MTNTETNATATGAETIVLVLKDGAGDYFLLPAEMAKRMRVPEAEKGAVEELVAQQHDVQGHLGIVGAGLIFATSVAICAAVVIGDTGSGVPGPRPDWALNLEHHIGQMERLRNM